MISKKNLLQACLVLMLLPSFSLQAKTYLTVEQAQKQIFPSLALTKVPVTLTSDQQSKLTDASSVRLPFEGDNVWKVADGSWLVVDKVVGKHEFITYVVAINADGTVKMVEVLEYNESYGSEVKEKSWMNQFVGKTAASPIKLNKDIANISGATLSSKHLSDGVKRVMTMYDLVLKQAK